MADDQDPNTVPAQRSVPASSAADRRDETATRAETPASTTGQGTASVEPKQVRLDPALEGHQRQGISGATWFALILGTVILVLLLIFILQNNEPADFAFLGLEFSLPLGIAMLFAAIAGVLITALLGSVRLFKVSRRMRRLEKERESIKQALR